MRIGRLPYYQMPAPSEVAQTLGDLAEGALWKHISTSLLRVLLGFAIGAGLALVFAARPGLFTGLRSGMRLAWMFLVAAELTSPLRTKKN